FKLQHLGSDARRIVHRVLGPANNLPAIVDGSCETIVAAECRQSLHVTELPLEANARVPAMRRRQEGATTPFLVVGICFVGIGNADDFAFIVDSGPEHRAIGTTERTQINRPPPDPQDCMGCRIAGEIRLAARPSQVVQRVIGTNTPSQWYAEIE